MRAVLALIGVLVLAGPIGALRLVPLPEATAHPVAQGTLDRAGLIDLSFLLSGTAPSVLPAYRGLLDRWSQEFKADPSFGAPEAKRAEALLFFLHKRLKSYEFYQTRLDVLVDRGTFNCVSSALAYLILGRDAGLNVQAVATTDHAFALVRLPDGRDVDVETTTPYGYDPGTKTGFTDSFGQTGFTYVPPGNYGQRRTIDERQLLGLLVQNRMGDWQRAGRPEEAVGPAIDRWVIEGSTEARGTLIDGFRNYAAWLNGRREYTKGLDLVDQMVSWTGEVPEAKELAWTFLNNHVGELLDRQNYATAQAVAQAWKNRGFLTEVQSTQTMALIADQELAFAVKTLPLAQAAARVDQAFAQDQVTPARRQELLSFLYGQEVQKIASKDGARAAWTYLGTLPAEVQAYPVLAKAREVYAYNWSVETHNRFAQLWNAGKKVEARRLLEDVLSENPTSTLLKKDLVLSQGQ